MPGTLHAAVVTGGRQNETETGAGRAGKGGESRLAGQSSMRPLAAKQIDNLAGTLAAGDPICHALSPRRGPVYGQSELRVLLLQLDGRN